MGRDFRSGEDRASSPCTVILSYGAWERRFAKDSGVIGKILYMGGIPYSVVGVLPQDFH